MPFYAVRNGRNPGIYTAWKDCRQQTDGYSNALYRKFDTRTEAEEFMNDARIDCEHEHVPVYTDGACVNNGRYGAVGGIGVYWGRPEHHQWNVSERLPGIPTSNRAEIMAAERALRQAKAMGIRHVTIYTDSWYLIQGITEWINMWKRNGWKLASGHDAANREDFEALDRSRIGLCVQWKYVPGHQKCLGNIEADRLAVAGARK